MKKQRNSKKIIVVYFNIFLTIRTSRQKSSKNIEDFKCTKNKLAYVKCYTKKCRIHMISKLSHSKSGHMLDHKGTINKLEFVNWIQVKYMFSDHSATWQKISSKIRTRKSAYVWLSNTLQNIPWIREDST